MKEKLKTICEPVTHVVKLNERKARIALVIIIAMLMQVFMPLMKVNAQNDGLVEITEEEYCSYNTAGTLKFQIWKEVKRFTV